MEHWRTAYRHNVKPSDIEYVLAHPEVVDEIDSRDGDPTFIAIGFDRTGTVRLEIIWVVGRRGPLVIHAMPMRKQFRHLLPEEDSE